MQSKSHPPQSLAVSPSTVHRSCTGFHPGFQDSFRMCVAKACVSPTSHKHTACPPTHPHVRRQVAKLRDSLATRLADIQLIVVEISFLESAAVAVDFCGYILHSHAQEPSQQRGHNCWERARAGCLSRFLTLLCCLSLCLSLRLSLYLSFSQ